VWGAANLAPSTQAATKAGVLVTAQTAGLDTAKETDPDEEFFSRKNLHRIIVTGVTGAIATVVSALLIEWVKGKKK
jgi:hypothetical protein